MHVDEKRTMIGTGIYPVTRFVMSMLSSQAAGPNNSLKQASGITPAIVLTKRALIIAS